VLKEICTIYGMGVMLIFICDFVLKDAYMILLRFVFIVFISFFALLLGEKR